MIATVEPLPLVPATWMTGGSFSCGSPSAGKQPLDAVERQVDLLRVELHQPRQDAVARRGRFSHRHSSRPSCPIGPAAGPPSGRCGSRSNERMRASVAANSPRGTT